MTKLDIPERGWGRRVVNSRRFSWPNYIRCPKPWSGKDSGLASTKSQLAALRDFGPANRRFGSW